MKKHKLSAIKAFQYDGWLCLELNDLWQAFYLLFNSAQNHQINMELLEKIPSKPITRWKLFSEEEFISVISKCNNLSTPGLDKLSWRHIKIIIKNVTCLWKLINIANTCINLGYWPSHFKTSSSIIIPKLNKTSYNSPKTFRPIVLLNMLSKLIEKVIGKRLQFQSILKDFIYLYQLDSLKQHSTTDVGVVLTYFIHTGWVKNLLTNTLVFNIVQFFLSLNYQLLPLILDKVEFNSKILSFFHDYLVGRKTKYLWNNFSSPSFNVDIGVGWGSTLSPILSALYLSPILYIFKKVKKSKNSSLFNFFCR